MLACTRRIRVQRFEGEPTTPTSRKLHITPLHPIKGLALRALGPLLEHAIAVRELAAENVTEDLRVAVRMGREAAPRGDAVFVEHAQTAKVHELVVEVVGEAECVEGLEPAAVLAVAALAGAAEGDLGVGEGV